MPDKGLKKRMHRSLDEFGEKVQSSKYDELVSGLEKKMQEKHRETQTKLRKSEIEARDVILNA